MSSSYPVHVTVGAEILIPSARYYEGKEFETSLKEKRPGDLSPELVEALSIPPLAPPPPLPLTPPLLSALTLDRCIHLPLTPSTALKNPVEPALNVR